MNESLKNIINESVISNLSVEELQAALAIANHQIKELSKEKELLIQDKEEKTHRYKELFHTSPSLMAILLGDNFIVESANHALLLALDKGEEIIGKPYLEVIPELEEQGLSDLMREVCLTGVPFHAEERPIDVIKEGKLQRYYFDFVYQPHRNINGEVSGVVVIATDVTSRAKLHEELNYSNHRFKELVYSSPGLIAILTGEDFMIETANDAIIEIWGKGADVIGKSIFTVLPEILEQKMDEKFKEVFNTGKPIVAQEFPIIHERNGEMIEGYFDFIYQPQRDMKGEIIGVAVIANEVTRTAKLNKKIRENEYKFRKLADIIPDMISNTDINLKTFYYNKSWLDFSGLSMKYLLENGWSELIHPDDIPGIHKNVAEALLNKSDFEMELRCRNRDGDYIWHLARATVVRDEAGEFQSWVSATTEIHKIKEEEKRKEDFMKMVSHELKTPVTSIKGYVQLLLSMLKMDNSLSNSAIPLKSSLERIDIQVGRLIRLISEILDISRLDDSQLVLQKTKFSINELVDQTIQDIKISNPLSDINIEHTFRSTVCADKDRIEQVIINLVTNSIKYSPDSKKIDINIFQEQEGKVSISITDFGIGIPENHIKNIFKRFYRVDGENEETFSGFGIGLFIVKEIIERHGGTIEVTSKIGKGSEFIFNLVTTISEQ